MGELVDTGEYIEDQSPDKVIVTNKRMMLVTTIYTLNYEDKYGNKFWNKQWLPRHKCLNPVRFLDGVYVCEKCKEMVEL